MSQRRRAFGFTVATGVVTWSLSERAFWGRVRPDDSVSDSLMTITAYTVVSYLALLLARHVAVTDGWRLFAVGAVLGWVVEGMVVATVYSALPFTIPWTGLAWHAPISVLLGWYLLPRWLTAGGRRPWLVCAGIGLGLGAWSAFMQSDAKVDADPAHAAATAALVAVSLGGSYVLQRLWSPAPDAFRLGRTGVLVALVLLGWAVALVFVPVPFAPLVLVPLLAGAYWLLRAGRPDLDEDVVPLALAVPGAPARRLGPLVLLVPAAVVGSAVFGQLDRPAALLAGQVTVVGGTLVSVLAAGQLVRRTLRHRRSSAAGPTTPAVLVEGGAQ